MHLIGLDLAWGNRNPTGVAVLDARGRLVELRAVRTDAEILAALGPYAEGPCVVGIDAPLIVENDTGSRPAEKALNADFAKFHAGAHPTNRGKPEFADGPRGARLAAELGLDLAPDSSSERRALEVYPHPATVALFELDRILAYKNKPGRDLESMRAALLQLTDLLASLARATPRLDLDYPAWHATVESIHAATRKSELRRAEDPVDAVVCAYVALLAARAPERLTTYGDGATGYIITPTLRPIRPRPGRDPLVSDAVRRYAAAHPALTEATEAWVARVTEALDDAGIDYLTITGRAKSVASYATKLTRLGPDREITDQIGLRVITYVHDDVTAVADLLADQTEVIDDRDLGLETAGEGRFGYASRHLLIRLPGQPTAQVQIRTVLQHAWAEFEHDIRYKGSIPDEHVPDLDRRFTLAAGLLELADREFSIIRTRLRGWQADADAEGDPDDPRLSAQELARFLADRFPDAGWSRTAHYDWISRVLLELGVTSLAELGGLLDSVDSEAITARMEYRYPPGAVRRLDDALLAIFTDRYLQLTTSADRRDSLGARLDRLRGEPPQPTGGPST